MNEQLIIMNKQSNPEAYQRAYEHMIEERIRQRYNVSQELAILRQRDTKPTEFTEYNQYVEDCKSQVKKLL